MDYEPIRAGLAASVPMVGFLGIELIEVGPGRGIARLPDDPRIQNHVKAQHAAGLFAVAETASGAAMVGALFQHLAGATPLAKSAEIQYQRLARGPITATATLPLDQVDAIVAALQSSGRAEFTIAVAMTDADDKAVAAMSVRWHVAKRA